MELTIDQILQRGVTVHGEGNLHEAERLYRTILNTQPAHPDANHNLGVIFISVNQASAALPLFKKALEANPKIEQFWISYIGALIKENQLSEAEGVLAQGMKSFLNSEKFDCLDQQLMSAKAFNAPPVSELHRLLEVFQTEQYDEAERSARTLIAQFPKHNFSWKILAAVLKKTGKVSESVFAGEKTVELNPDDAESHYNLGNTFELLRRLDEAEAEYKQAITLQADYAEAHNNLGKMLKELGRFDEAETSLKHAISLKPDFFEALNNLGNSLSMMGRLEEAEASYRKAIALSPDYKPPHGNLGSLLLKLGKHQEGLNEQMIGEGLITFDLKHGLFII